MRTLVDLFLQTIQRGLSRQFTFGRGGKAQAISSARFGEDVLRAAQVLTGEYEDASRIAMVGENCYPYIVAYFACLLSGYVPVLVDKDSASDEMSERCIAARCDALLFSTDYAEAREITGLPGMGFDEMISRSMETSDAEHATLLSEFISRVQDRIDADDIATVFFTSSSTGTPKVVPLSHMNIVSALIAGQDAITFEGSTVLCLPLHHVFGMVTGLLTSMAFGMEIHINESLRYLRADIAQRQPSVLFMVPQMYLMIVASMKGNTSVEAFNKVFGRNLSDLVFGGGPLPHVPAEAFDAGVNVRVGYGLTETSSSVCLCKLQLDSDSLDLAGFPLPGVDARISDTGEILLKGPSIFDGYESVAQPRYAFDEEGYFHTEDLGYYDDSGILHISGRLKNLIILPNGENVPAEYLEERLYRLPYIEECLVSEDCGHICAFIFANNRSVAESEISKDLAEINRNLKLDFNINRYVFVDEPFEKTVTYKIKRNR